MDLEKKRGLTPDNLDDFLEQADQAQGVTANRITESLAIDGETHPKRQLVIEEIQRLDARKRKRTPRKSPKRF